MQKEFTPGMIRAFLLDGHGGGTGISWEELKAWTPDRGPLWIHIGTDHEVIEEWLREKSGLPLAVCDALLAAETRPRYTLFDDGILVSLRGVNLNPGANPEDMVSIRMWVDGNRMVSRARRRLMAVADMEEAIQAGRGPKSAAGLLTTVAHYLLQRMVPTLEDLSDAVDLQEELAMTESSGELQTNLAEYRRQVIGLRRHLAPQREALTQIAHGNFAAFDAKHRGTMQLLADHVTRYVEELDELRERTAVTHDLLSGRQSDLMNSRMLTLSIVTAIFLPLGLVTGLLGINVGGIPGASFDWAFVIVCGLLVALAGFQLYMMHRMKWF